MARGDYSFAVVLLFAHTSYSYVSQLENTTVPAARGKHYSDHGYYTKCTDDEECGPELVCVFGRCRCDHGYYFQEVCKICPGYNEYCGFANCCDNPALYYCGGDICRCKQPGSKECREPSPSHVGNVQMVTAFQVILASIFSVALFALFIQCWRTCCWKKVLPQRQAIRNDSRPSVVNTEHIPTSRVPLEVSTVVRDAPPRYDDLNHIQFEKPPPYQEAINNSLSSQVGRQSEEMLPYVYPTAPVENYSAGVENEAFTTDDNQNTTVSSRVPRNSCCSFPQAVNDSRQDHENLAYVRSEEVETSSIAGAVVLTPADLVNQQPASEVHTRNNKQTNPPMTDPDRGFVCQVHRTES